jgi:glycosyltransferase involved in cell wall biosynthesis
LYIVKNEDLWLGKSIENLLAGRVRPGKITVVDTGSVDDTVPIVRNLGVKLVEIEMLPQDLGEVKNYYLRKAKSDIVLNLDGNEILPVRFVEIIDDVLNCLNWKYKHLSSLGFPFLEVDSIESVVVHGVESWKIGHRGAPITRARVFHRDRVSFRRGYPNLRMRRPGVNLSTYPKEHYGLHMRRLGQSSRDKELYSGRRNPKMIKEFSRYPINDVKFKKSDLLL